MKREYTKQEGRCLLCSSLAVVKGRCRACYDYLRITGKERSGKLINDYDSNGHLSVAERIDRAKAKVRAMRLGRQI